MKRLVSLLLSLAVVVSLIPAALATGSPPYSLEYLNNIEGTKYSKFITLDDIETSEYSRLQRTLEVYDVFELYLSAGGSWSATIEPFRKAFQKAGFKEDVISDQNNQDTYCYSLNNDVFIILGEKASQAILNESGLVYIEHNYVTAPSTTAPSNPTQTNPSSPSSTITAQQAAQSLYELGLFSGTGTDASGNPNFDLDRAPTRHEAVTMLVRLLGKASEAESGNWNTPFTDVANWAKPYVGYAYTNGLISGTSATTYGGDQIVTASQYLTFVLRALGYQVGTDFQWDKAWELSDKIGLTNGQYNSSTANFTRGDVAIISNNTLSVKLKNSTQTLRDSLNTTMPGGKLNTPTISANSRWTYNYRLPNGNFSGSRYVMNVKWTPVSDADGYILYVKQGDWGTWEKYKTYDSSATGDIFDYWRSGIVYSFKVVAYKGSGTNIVYSDESNIASEMWYSPKSN